VAILEKKNTDSEPCMGVAVASPWVFELSLVLCSDDGPFEFGTQQAGVVASKQAEVIREIPLLAFINT